MTAWDDKDEDGRALWEQSRPAVLRDERGVDETVDPSLLAAYLEGRLSESERAALEAVLAGSEAGLDLLLASRAALAETPTAVSDRVVRRAQALIGFAAAPARQGLFAWLLGGSPLRPLAAAGAFAAYLLVCVISFDLGRGEGVALADLGDAPAPAALEEELAQAPLWGLEIEDVL